MWCLSWECGIVWAGIGYTLCWLNAKRCGVVKKINLIYELDEDAKRDLVFAPQYITQHLSFMAAREIERLRASLKKYKGQVNKCGKCSANDVLDEFNCGRITGKGVWK